MKCASKLLLLGAAVLVGASALAKRKNETSGKLGYPESYVNEVVQARRNDIRQCHEAALKQHPKLSGKVALGWTIRPSGDVLNVRIVENTTNNASLAECMTEKLKSWKFGTFVGADRVVDAFPFWLSPAE
jgi:hypothetical protein